MRTNRPHRLKEFNYLGCYRYSLTFCTHLRAKLFAESDVVELVLSQFLRAVGKQYAGYAYSKKYGARLWQPWGFERVLRHEDASLAVARYIVENSVRGGLVKVVEDYPFVGSQVYELKDLIASLPT